MCLVFPLDYKFYKNRGHICLLHGHDLQHQTKYLFIYLREGRGGRAEREREGTSSRLYPKHQARCGA